MATLTLRVPDELKARMSEFDLNWSQALRDAIEERLRYERRKRAIEEMNEIADRIFKRTGKYSNASELIIKWRRLH